LATSCQVEEEYVDHQITLKAVDIMAAAQNAVTYQTIEEAGFAAYVRLLREKIDKTAADETDQDVLNALAELSEALPRMLAASATAEDVMPHHQAERARIYFAFDIDEAMNMIATAAATGNVDYEVRSARKAIQHIDDFTEAVEEMGAASETVLATSCEVAQEHVMDGQDDQVQLPMSNDEQALLDQLDYRELAMAIDHTLDEWRQEASGCSSDGLPTDRISSTIWI
jgi:hypothetical protein